jgi:hypothetical protein
VATRTVSDSGVGKKMARRCVCGWRLEGWENSGRGKAARRVMMLLGSELAGCRAARRVRKARCPSGEVVKAI